MRIALDTNILVYAEQVGDPERCDRACALVDALPVHHVVIPAQCLGELFRVLHGKAALSKTEAVERVLAWTELFIIADSTIQAFLLALDLVRAHMIQIWDALMIAVASVAQCRVIASEDIPSETSLSGVKIRSPFTDAGYQDILMVAAR